MGKRTVFVITIALTAMFSIAPIHAAAVHEFHDAVADAFAPYRQAVYYLRTGNGAVALLQLDQLSVKWRVVEQRFADSPPGIYADDTAWRETLITIGDAVEAGLAAAEADDLEAASRLLKPIRGDLSRLRHRNGVFLFTDCVGRANAAFDRLFTYRREPPDFVDVESVNGLRRALTLTIYWYETCRDTAPAALKTDEQFQRIMDSAIESLGFIWQAIDDQDTNRVINNLRGLISSDRLFFLKFG